MAGPRSPLLLIVLAGTLILTGCTTTPEPTVSIPVSTTQSSSSAATPSASTTASETPSSSALTPSDAPSSAAELKYLAATQQLSATLAAASPRTVLALGRTTCNGFKQGRTAGEVLQELGKDPDAANFSGSEAAVVLGAAVSELCPQYRKRLAAQ